MRTEKSWVEFISGLWGPSGADLGIGDDGCILPSRRYAVTSDVLVEDVDFSLLWGPPEAIGHKALASNLSDLAAMGAVPRFMLLSIGFPRRIPDGWMERMLSGMAALAKRESVGLCGGDLSDSPGGLFLSLTLLGEQVHPPLVRSGGRPRDLLYAGGDLGGPRRALELFRGGAKLDEFAPENGQVAGSDQLLRRFFEPPSQTRLGLYLAGRHLATSCIDLSDGFASDLWKLCEASGCGAEIFEAQLPIGCIAQAAPASRESDLECALRGGEEQILLFSIPPNREPELSRFDFVTHRVGILAERSAGLVLVRPDGSRKPLDMKGYDHFDPAV